jgi:hypothetical protein
MEMGNASKTAPLERKIHLGIVQLLKLNAAPGVVWFHCPNERRTTPREGAFLKRMGVLAGVADFTILIPDDFLDQKQEHGDPVWASIPRIAFLEIKRPGGRLSVAQEQFRDDVTAIGCLWALAYSTDQAAGFLKEWGALRSSASSTQRAAA